MEKYLRETKLLDFSHPDIRELFHPYIILSKMTLFLVTTNLMKYQLRRS